MGGEDKAIEIVKDSVAYANEMFDLMDKAKDTNINSCEFKLEKPLLV